MNNSGPNKNRKPNVNLMNKVEAQMAALGIGNKNRFTGPARNQTHRRSRSGSRSGSRSRSGSGRKRKTRRS